MLIYFWPSDDEQLAGQWLDSHMAEDANWWIGVQQAGATIALATVLTLATVSTALATSVFSQSQDDPAASLISQPAVQEDYWLNPVAPVNWPQPAAGIADDPHVAFAQTFAPDDGQDVNLSLFTALRGYKIPQAFLWTSGGGALPPVAQTVPLDDASSWAPGLVLWEPNWTLLFFLDDGSTVPVFQYDEDFWINPVQPQLWWTAPQPFQAADDDSFVQIFSGNDEGVWNPQIPPVDRLLRILQPFVFEQNEQSANLVTFTNEDYWQNPTPPVADSIWLLRQDSFDTQDPAGSLTLVLDDGFQPNFVPPVPDSLRLLQQWPFDEFESSGALYSLVDEFYWQNPVAPVNWPQPSVITDDPVITVFVPSFQPDEDFWPQYVRPVPDSLYLRLPFNQEDDTPVLVTPPPPPPPPPTFCPVPPTGPDADTSMSLFAQGSVLGPAQPIQALFCRICKSGKPLIVRADYAIWCQDCCAFVSKQDTYMGTVRAPGQFRGRF